MFTSISSSGPRGFVEGCHFILTTIVSSSFKLRYILDKKYGVVSAGKKQSFVTMFFNIGGSVLGK